MFNHIMVGSNDLARSEAFYNAVLGVLGAGAPLRNQSPSGHMRLFYRHDGSTFCVAEPIDGGPATCANGATIGFKCASEEQAKAFHDMGARKEQSRIVLDKASARPPPSSLPSPGQP